MSWLNFLQEQPPPTEGSIRYGQIWNNNIYLQIEGMTDAYFAILEINYASNSVPNFSFYNDQLETELSENEDFNMDDFQQTIPNPWIITTGSSRLLISSFTQTPWPTGIPSQGISLCSYTSSFPEFITGARLVDWYGNIVNLSVLYNPGNPNVRPAREIGHMDTVLNDSTGPIIGEVVPPQIQTYAQQSKGNNAKTGYSLKNQNFLNKLRKSFYNKSNKVRRVKAPNSKGLKKGPGGYNPRGGGGSSTGGSY